MGRQLMVLHEDVDGLHRLLEVAFNLGGGLGSRVRNAEGMQREREGFQVAAIGVVRFFPAHHLGLPHRHQRLGLWGILGRLGPSLEAGEGLRGCLEFLVCVSEVSAQGQRIALDDSKSTPYGYNACNISR